MSFYFAGIIKNPILFSIRERSFKNPNDEL